MINEFSNGPAGTQQEFYELIVTGPPGTMQDIRGFIIDDHGGHFGCGSGNGISTGHIRFAQHSQWACIPVGSMIVIYNSADPNPALPAMDITDANGDHIYIIPDSASTVLNIFNTGPNQLACNNYAMATGGSTTLDWATVDLDTAGDVAVIVDPSNTITPIHAIGYGSLTGIPPTIIIPGSGNNTNFSFNNASSNNYRALANWTTGTAALKDTPGAPNNSTNQIWMDSLDSPILSNITTGCVPLTVNFSTSSIASSHTYLWDFGDGTTATGATQAHTFNSTGTFSVVLKISHPNGCFSLDTQNIIVNPAITAGFNSLPDVCINSTPVNLTGASPTGGTYSGLGVSGNTFDPAAAGAGTHTITYSITGVCPATATQTIQVDPIPNISITAIPNLCASGTPITLSATPTGGTFLGSGVTGSSFSPILAGAGTHQVYYNITGTCSATDTQNVTVDTVPNVAISSIASLCTSSAPVILSGTPSGGAFSGNGVTGSSFAPSSAGTGSHSITYSVTSGACTGNASTSAQVVAVPNVTLASFNDVCISAPSFALNGGTPSGGTYSGTGVNSGQFSPATAGAGTHFITYTYSNGVCSSSATSSITVVPIPNVQFSIPAVECISASTINITNASPTGGTFSGPGVTGSSFDPSTAGIGNHDIVYTYTNVCTTSDTQTISIQPTPSASITSLANICQNNPTIPLNNGTPVGGTYSGTAVVGNTFSPQIAGPGNHNITYTIQVGTCADSQTTSIVIDSLIVSSQQAISPVCEVAAPFPLTQGQPTGGVYKINGTVTTNFNPNTMGAGSHNVTYVITNGTCADSSVAGIIVDPTPNINFNTLPDICQNVSQIPLTQASPAGGTYSGNGVSNATFQPTSAGAGNHFIHYTITNGACTVSDSQSINVIAAPVAQFTLPTTICLNQKIFNLTSGIPSGGAYSGAGVYGSQIDLTTLTNGNQQYTYVVSNGGCSDTAMTTTTFLADANGEILPKGKIEICQGNSQVLKATGGPKFVWNTGDTLGLINVNASGIYTCSISNQCGGMKDSVEVTVLPIPQTKVSADTNLFCKGNSLEIKAQSNLPLVWSNGEKDSVISVNTPGVYKAYSVNKCGLSADSIEVFVSEVKADFEYEYDPFTAPYELRLTNLSTNGIQYDWNFGDSATSDVEDPVHTYDQFGNYRITLMATNAFGCKDSLTSEWVKVELPARVFIPSAFTPDGDGINDVFQVVSSYHSKFSGAIFNRWGNEIFRFNDASDSWNGKNGTIPMIPGVYVYRFNIDDKEYVGQVTLIR